MAGFETVISRLVLVHCCALGACGACRWGDEQLATPFLEKLHREHGGAKK